MRVHDGATARRTKIKKQKEEYMYKAPKNAPPPPPQRTEQPRKMFPVVRASETTGRSLAGRWPSGTHPPRDRLGGGRKLTASGSAPDWGRHQSRPGINAPNKWVAWGLTGTAPRPPMTAFAFCVSSRSAHLTQCLLYVSPAPVCILRSDCFTCLQP